MANTFLKANWENLIMANYEVEPSILKPYLPNGVELDFYKYKSYVSLVGFMFNKTSLFGLPIPFFGSFEEINLRFYVRKVDGKKIKKGVLFTNKVMQIAINQDHHPEMNVHYNFVKLRITDYEKGAVSEKCHRFVNAVNKIT